ncbi:hypothetical protein RHJ63_00280 [Thermosynechococcus sp. JY1334]|uniref:hypothetical protein n=1 Tax=unclassified Thermosynechococcus TaxID=2622553 RepID=UPI0026722600|nr:MULTISPECIES: hypothetical protein [unclassified Thermosynechococcus]MDR7896762.1 hypothetical protein [Thermosynechococcus sp. JY1332]MDR7904159.1 hypothetical protein [Thermosynechococcus sp. JY1334]MDR7991993.1 hypothetical protein [Thermosynechococcus sp. TG252]WKT86413.1 hypothetical protein QYC30_00280 [Thermosynechococcus sp. JY1339]WNC55359.1 hypothetical protein RHJ31_00280 [Thermosynechococcus sp. JY1331]
MEPQDEVRQVYEETQTRMAELYREYEQIKATQARLKGGNQAALDQERDRLVQELRQLEAEFGLTLLFHLGEAARECWQDILAQENFWHFVRFAGLGFVLGLLVKSLTG